MIRCPSHSPWRHLIVSVILLAGVGYGDAFAQRHRETLGPEPPASALPRFFQIESWEGRSRVPDNIAAQLNGPAAIAIAHLQQFAGAVGGSPTIPNTGLSPLEWPRVFAGDRISPRTLRVELETRMRDAGIEFREILAFEGNKLPDSFVTAISAGTPILLNAPDCPILFGYDRREPDTWWWRQSGSSADILLESERTAEYVYWADDPASNIAWAILGPDTTVAPPDQEEAEFAYLGVVNRSVQGDGAIGLRGYPVSVRAFRDTVATAVGLPTLRDPVSVSDPIGIRRVLDARRRLTGILESLTLRVVDSTVSQPLRLALYFYHNSIQSLERVESILYKGSSETAVLDRLTENWGDTVHRPQAADAITDALEWERQAAEQIALALSARKPPKR